MIAKKAVIAFAMMLMAGLAVNASAATVSGPVPKYWNFGDTVYGTPSEWRLIVLSYVLGAGETIAEFIVDPDPIDFRSQGPICPYVSGPAGKCENTYRLDPAILGRTSTDISLSLFINKADGTQDLFVRSFTLAGNGVLFVPLPSTLLLLLTGLASVAGVGLWRKRFST